MQATSRSGPGAETAPAQILAHAPFNQHGTDVPGGLCPALRGNKGKAGRACGLLQRGWPGAQGALTRQMSPEQVYMELQWDMEEETINSNSEKVTHGRAGDGTAELWRISRGIPGKRGEDFWADE